MVEGVAARSERGVRLQSAHLFLMPGLAHCRAGIGPNADVGWLTPLLRWIEEGVALSTLGTDIFAAHDAPVQSFLGSERFGSRH